MSLILRDGLEVTHVVSIPADVSRAFASRAIWRQEVLDAATVYEGRLPLPAHVAGDRTAIVTTIEQAQQRIG